MTQLSLHFTLEELTFSQEAVRKGIDNTPTPAAAERLEYLAAGLEHIRKVLGLPMHVSSAYRCPALNSLIGGSPTSAHMDGDAADFECLLDPRTVCAMIMTSDVRFDQLIMEGTWTHVSFSPRMRHEVLTAVFKNGVAAYYTGLSK